MWLRLRWLRQRLAFKNVTRDQAFKSIIKAMLCMVFSVYFAGNSSYSEASMYSLRSSASLPSHPVNCAVQHLRGFSQNPGVSLIVKISDLTSYFMSVQIVNYQNKMILDCANKKAFEFYLLDNPHSFK